MQVADLFAKLSLKTDKHSFERGEKILETIKHGLEAIAIFELGKKVVEAFHEITETAEQFHLLSQQVGVSSTSLQELAYAGKFAGISTEDLGTSLGFLNRHIFEARHGSAQLADLFHHLGIKQKDLKNIKADEALERIAQAFQKMPDGPKKNAAAVELFGRSGRRLIPLLNKGKEGLAALRKEFKDTGAEIDDNTSESFVEFGHTMVKLKTIGQGFMVEFVKVLAPVLKDLAEDTLAWVRANKDLLRERIKEFAERVGQAFEALGEFFSYLLEHQDEVKDFIKIAVEGWLAIQAVSVAAAIATNLAWLPVLATLGAAFAIYEELKDAKLSDFTPGGGANDVSAERKNELDAVRQYRYQQYRHPGQNAAIQTAAPSSAQNTAGATGPVTINFNIPPGTDEKEVIRLFREQWDSTMRRSGGAVGLYGSGAQ